MKPRIPHPLRDPPCNLCDIFTYGYFHQLRLLICSGIQLECRNDLRRTPIMLCAFMEPEQWGIGTARTMIENGVRMDKKDKFGRNALHYACIYERFGLIHVLLKAIDFDLGEQDKLGNNALHYAAMSGNVAVTQVISRHYQRYKIGVDNPNKRGLTAVGEAQRLGNSACARIIEQDRNDSSQGNGIVKELHFDELVSASNENGQYLAPKSNGKVNEMHNLSVIYRPSSARPSSARPRSQAFLTRRDSSTSLNSTVERRSSFSHQSRFNQSRRRGHRNHQSPLLAMGIKKEDHVIHCADEKDFRNTPDFVFKLLHLHFDLHEWNPNQNLDSTVKNGVWNDAASNNQSQTLPLGSRPTWRQDFKSLFQVYESQCSSSWRAAPKSPSNATEEQERAENEEEDRGKKTRRQSNHSRPGGVGKEQAIPEIKRRPSATRIRRLSSVHGILSKMGGPGSVDGNLDTSSESINSWVSTNKKRGSEREQNTTGRTEAYTNRAGLRRPSLEPSRSSSACSSPTPSIVTNEPQKSSKIMDEKAIGTSLNNLIHNKVFKGNNLTNYNESIATSRSEKMTLASVKIGIQRRASQDAQDIAGSSKRNPKEKITPVEKAGSAVCQQIKIPCVKETLVPDENRFSVEANTHLDTTKLWVQNPYEEDEEGLSDEDDEVGELKCA